MAENLDYEIFDNFDFTGYETPCVPDCKRELVNGVCPQCKRTVDEITNWYYYTPDERHTLMLDIKNR